MEHNRRRSHHARSSRCRSLPCRLAALFLFVLISGCMSMPIVGPTLLLTRADRLAREGAWHGAVASYDEFLVRFPDDNAAPRVLESRDTLAAMLLARAELARRREEVDRLRDELTKLGEEGGWLREELDRREWDLARARQDLAARQAEAERLRLDIERLKQVDLKLERKR